jgi:hypothetical protein
MTSRHVLLSPLAAVLISLAPMTALAQTPATSPPTEDLTSATQAPPAAPQAQTASHWGFNVSVTPRWRIPGYLTSTITDSGGVMSVTGSQFTIGIVRGRTDSGDWGVSFVREPVKDGSTGDNNKTDCNTVPGQCFDTSTAVVTQAVMMTGVEIHKFIPFGLIHGRVQIGINVAGGIAKLSGNFLETKHKINVAVVPGNPPQQIVTPVTTVSTTAVADELGFSTVPLMQLGPVVTVIVAPALKVYWEGGVMIPGNTFFQLRATYLIGAR